MMDDEQRKGILAEIVKWTYVPPIESDEVTIVECQAAMGVVYDTARNRLRTLQDKGELTSRMVINKDGRRVRAYKKSRRL